MKRFQNRAAESYLSLPATAIYSLLIWLSVGLVTHSLWVSMLLTAVCTYMIAEMNNRNSLLRIRSRMMSCVYLVLTTLLATLTTDWHVAAIQAITLLCLCLLHVTYKDRNSINTIFSIFMLISAGSMIWIQYISILPIFFVMICIPMYAMSLKGFSAAVMGLLLPYWLALPVLIYRGDYETALNHITQIADLSIFFNYSNVTIGQLALLTYLILLFVMSWTHFVNTSYKDKMKTRSYFNVYISVTLLLVAFIIIAPGTANYTLSMMILFVSPLIAHYFSLTESKFTNIVFITTIILILATTIIGVATDWLHQPISALIQNA